MAEPTKPPRKRKTFEERLEIVKRKHAQAASRLAKLTAKIGKSERSRDALCKIYVGGMMMAFARAEEKIARYLRDKLKEATPNDREREALAPFIAELDAILRAKNSGEGRGRGPVVNRVAFELKTQLATAMLSYTIARPDLEAEKISAKVLEIYLAIFDQAVLTATIRKFANEAGMSADELIALVRDE